MEVLLVSLHLRLPVLTSTHPEIFVAPSSTQAETLHKSVSPNFPQEKVCLSHNSTYSTAWGGLCRCLIIVLSSHVCAVRRLCSAAELLLYRTYCVWTAELMCVGRSLCTVCAVQSSCVCVCVSRTELVCLLYKAYGCEVPSLCIALYMHGRAGAQHVQSWCTACAELVLSSYRAGALHVQNWCTACTELVHCMYRAGARYVQGLGGCSSCACGLDRACV